MGDFSTHMRAGITAYAILPPIAAGAHLAGSPAPALLAASAPALPFALAGAAFPDLDAKQSIPFRHFRLAVATLTAVVVGAALYAGRSVLVTLAVALPVQTPPEFVAGVVYALLVVGSARIIYGFLYVYNPPHRGVLHQLPSGIVATLVLFALCAWFAVSLSLPSPARIATLLAGGFFVGFLSHLFVDRDPHEGRSLLLVRRTYVGKRLDERLP